MNNDLATWLRDFANANEDSFESDQIRNLLDAACEIRDLRETVNDLTAWNQGVEADNDTLRNEIRRLHEERNNA
jgi:FtsZ-binding cell division protein ZapB